MAKLKVVILISGRGSNMAALIDAAMNGKEVTAVVEWVNQRAGTQRATTLVALELLAQAGAVPRAEADRVAALTTEKVLGKGVPVGAIRTVF